MELVDIQKFIADMGYLSFGRDYIMCRNKVFSLQTVMTSVEFTLGHIYHCCEYACLADANTLTRKYRDDLFFYLYLTVYNSSRNLGYSSKALDIMENNIDAWLADGLRDLHIGDVLKAIASMKKLRNASQKYNLKSSFDIIRDRLNNFVHSNGRSFYNQNALAYQNNGLEEELNKIVNDVKFITTTFMFLLVLCSPGLVMSPDYVDYLDCQMEPPDGSQYWVAPFIEKFFHDNIQCIDDTCLKYLRENTPMQF